MNLLLTIVLASLASLISCARLAEKIISKLNPTRVAVSISVVAVAYEYVGPFSPPAFKPKLPEVFPQLLVALKSDLPINQGKKTIGYSPLMMAILGGKLEEIEDIVLVGSDLNFQQPISGETALHMAANSR